MEPYASFLLTLGIALILAKMAGGAIERFGVPGVLGEIAVGIFLGNLILLDPSVGTVINFSDEAFDFLSHLGIIFLLFIAGLETDIRSLRKTGKAATLSTLGGVFVPLILGYFIVKSMFGYADREAFAVGVLLTATSIGITVRVMMDLGVLRSRVGSASLSASVMDDFIGIALIVLATGQGTLLEILASIGIFIAVTLVLGWFYIEKVLSTLNHFFRTPKGALAYSLGVMLLFSALAEHAFQAAIEGSFIAGLIIHRTVEYNAIIEDVKGISYGFLVPLFFVYIGSILDLTVFTRSDVLLLALIITVVAIFGKLTGRGIFARVGGFTWRESLQMGVGSIPRMEVALVSVAVAIKSGAIAPPHVAPVLAATMVFVTVTTLVTPPLLKISFRRERMEAGAVT